MHSNKNAPCKLPALTLAGAVSLLLACQQGETAGHKAAEQSAWPVAAQEEEVCTPDTVQCAEADTVACVDLSTSVRHCGTCGRRCFSDQACSEGACTGVGVIGPQELKAALQEKNFKLINVRLPPVGIIPGTDASIRHDDLERLVELIGPDREQPVVLYCGTSTRIKVALRLLRERGYRNVSVLENGVMSWRKAGYPVEL